MTSLVIARRQILNRFLRANVDVVFEAILYCTITVIIIIRRNLKFNRLSAKSEVRVRVKGGTKSTVKMLGVRQAEIRTQTSSHNDHFEECGPPALAPTITITEHQK